MMALLLMVVLTTHATTYEVDGLFYMLCEDGTAMVVAPGSGSEGSSIPIGFSQGYFGDIVVPAEVECGGAVRTVSTIDDYAFLGGTLLTSVTLPATVTHIGDTPFANSTKLTTITVADNNPAYSSLDGVLFDKARTTLIACPAAKSGSYDIPSTVDSICTSAFYGCASLTSLTLPPTVRSIGVYAFRGCSNISMLAIPEGVTEVKSGTFYGCRCMRTITLPTTLRSIGPTAFFYCQSLQEMSIPEGVVSIGQNAFEDCVSLHTLNLPTSLKNIGSRAFANCSNLPAVAIPAGVSTIGSAPFANCIVLKAIEVESANTHYCSIDGVLLDIDATHLICYPAGKDGDYTMPSTVTVVGKSAFTSCRKLTGIVMSDVLDTISTTAFNGCRSLTDLVLPVNLRSIGENAFINCTGLTSITCYALTPPVVAASNTFPKATYSLPLYVAPRRVAAYKKATVWRDFKSILPIPEGMEVRPEMAFTGMFTALDIALQVAESGVRSYEFDLVLPEGVTPAMDSDGAPLCTFTTRHEGTPTLVMEALEDNAWHIKVSMDNNSQLKGYEGDVMRLLLDVDTNMAPDTYPATLDNPMVTLFDGYQVEIDNVNFDLLVSGYILGDINRDGMVSVGDVTYLVEVILGHQANGYLWQLGDLNKDSITSIADITYLVNIILGN